MKFITDNSRSTPTAQVIHKRVRKLKARETRDGSSNSDKRLKKWMKQFGDQPENVGRIFLDDVNQKPGGPRYYWCWCIFDGYTEDNETVARGYESIKLVEKALTWVNTIDSMLTIPMAFQVAQQMDLTSKVKPMPLVSVKAEVLDLIGKTQLSDDTMNIVMVKLFGPRKDVIVVSPDVIGSFGDVGTSVLMMCCHKYHWCATMIDVELKDISIYDPTSSSYIVGVRAIAEKLATQLPDYAPRRSWRPSRQLQLRYACPVAI
ncbi:hypothetical protein JG687_00000746 [Phytophthora cactorum]|uniref:Ubiquitin-like protease family profile domain-containing protein n=1 Tax=Phytophthora cactorum TaxID=29920 RepID=A0A8T1V1R3_9STRA|nr:hypothetical protein JG687_00000746 [Phytophthora cactorum]